MKTTLEVFNHHSVAFANRDLDEVMADFSENAIYITSDKVVRGKEGIRKLYKAHFDAQVEGSSSQIINQIIEGEIVFFEWTAETPAIRILDGVDTFVIREGLIQAQTVRSTAVPKM